MATDRMAHNPSAPIVRSMIPVPDDQSTEPNGVSFETLTAGVQGRVSLLCNDRSVNDELRDAYLDDVADTVRQSIEALAVGLRRGGTADEHIAWGDALPSLKRLRGVVGDSDRRADLLRVVGELLASAAHRQLVVLDGGTKLSDDGRRVFLTDTSGDVVAEGLHEWLFDHLDVETTR